MEENKIRERTPDLTSHDVEQIFEAHELSHTISFFKFSSDTTTKCLDALKLLILDMDETIKKLQL